MISLAGGRHPTATEDSLSACRDDFVLYSKASPMVLAIAYRHRPVRALTCASGDVPFGPSHLTMLVNDQMGYWCERPQVRAELQTGQFDALLRLAQEGLRIGIQVMNVQLMEPSLDEAALVPEVTRMLHETIGRAIAIDPQDLKIVAEALNVYLLKALCNCVNGKRQDLDAMLPRKRSAGECGRQEYRAIDFLLGQDPYAKKFLAYYRAHSGDVTNGEERVPPPSRRGKEVKHRNNASLISSPTQDTGPHGQPSRHLP